MADGFIVRRGGKVSEQALAPTITETETTISSFKFTLKNEDTDKAIIRYRIDDIDDEGEIIELAGGATSDDIEITGLDEGTEYIVFATANVTGKVKSNVTQLAIETESVIYTAATGGTTNDYNLDGKRYRSHTFTSDGNFVVTTAGNGDRNQVDYLIIAGGGGGGRDGRGAGGGAGGFLTTIAPVPSNQSPNAKATVTATTFGVVVGAGGAGGILNSATGGSGTNSSIAFSGTPTAIGGGGGGSNQASQNQGLNGGSGGGSSSTSFSGGLGTTSQGRNGGNGLDPSIGGGGGGAGAVGQNPTSSKAGDGGDGLANLLRTGSNETRAGGGGGGAFSGNWSNGVGGSGGGGNGGTGSADNGTPGTDNTGGGGGAGGTQAGIASYDGKKGGSGIVIIRYEIAPTV